VQEFWKKSYGSLPDFIFGFLGEKEIESIIYRCLAESIFIFVNYINVKQIKKTKFQLFLIAYIISALIFWQLFIP
jgi:hypothetical protein